MINKEHPQAHILRAIADGITVQARWTKNDWDWFDFNPNIHTFHIGRGLEWRIKPKPKVKKYKVVMFQKGTNKLEVSRHYYKDKDEFEKVNTYSVFVQLIEATMIEVEND